jgi:membrane associated rhomboid family serine protease
MIVRDEGLSFVKSLGRILFFLCLLPGFVTYVHLRQEVSLPSNELKGSGGSGSSDVHSWQKSLFSDKNHIADIASHSYYWLPASAVIKNANRPDRIRHSYWNLIVHKIPATSFFITLNVLLAFYYWNHNIQPTAVAKIYTNMVAGGEIWRSFSGPTAHFDLWHLALNMMSLSALGKEIEGSRILSSLAFWMYNITFIPFIAGLWIGMQWIADHLAHARSRSTSSDNLHKPTVGYSGVLFAWMVVASLEQQSTCPVIFMPDLCFKTYDMNGFKWSWSPIVQLIVMQVLLPRVSFIGHLAGILAGFLLHWGVMPLKLMHPANAIPILHLIYLGCCRKITSLQSIQASNAEPTHANRLLGLLFCQLLLMAISAVTFGPTSTFAIAQVPVALLWYFYSNERKKSCGSGSQSASLTLARGLTFCSVLALATDSMTLASWIALNTWSSFIILLMFTRFIVVLLSMLMAITILPASEAGIFWYVFEFTVLEPSRMLVCHPWIGRFFNGKFVAGLATPAVRGLPFGGEGRRLGGGSSQEDISENPSTEEISQLLKNDRV